MANYVGGREVIPIGAINGIILSIGQAFEGNSVITSLIILNSTPIYLRALIDDEEFLAEVLQIFEDMKRRFGTKTIEPKQG